MKRLGILVVLAAVALSLFNTWQITQLRRELNAPRKESAAATAKPEQSESRGVQKLLASAQEHSARANRLRARGDIKGAQEEARKSLEALREAERLMSAQTSRVRDTFQSAQDKLKGILEQFAAEPEKKGGK